MSNQMFYTALYLIVAVALLIYKVTGIIAWSWWLVLAPLYLPFILIFPIVAGGLIALGLLFGNYKGRYA